MQQTESAVFSNVYEYESSWWQEALQALGKIRLQTVRTFEVDGTKRDYPVEYLALDPSSGTWKSPTDLGSSRFAWRGKKRFMRLVELRLRWEELVDDFQVLLSPRDSSLGLTNLEGGGGGGGGGGKFIQS